MRAMLRPLAGLAVIAVVVGCAAPAVSPSAAASEPAPSPPAVAGCPPFDPGPGLGVSFLSEPLAAPDEGFVAQVLIAPETGETDLGRLPVQLATEIRGPAPVHDPDWRAGALEAGGTDGCGLRVLVDESALTTGMKGLPLWVDVGLPAARITQGQDGSGGSFCTWLSLAEGSSAAIECVNLQPDPPVTGPVRAWIRMAWSKPVTAAGSMPDWAATAMATPPASPASSPVAGLRLVPAGPAEAFALTDPPFADGSSLEMRTVAAGPGGWVAGGTYQPAGSGDKTSEADAPFWFSVNGRTWERVGVGDPDLGGPGDQSVTDVVATPAGWWALGRSVANVFDTAPWTPRFWSSPDGHAWDSVALDPCRLDVCPDLLGQTASLRALPDGALLLVGTARVGDASTPGWWRLDGTAITAGGALPRAGDIPVGEGIDSVAAVASTDGLVVLATVASTERVRVLAWTSPDGSTWTQADDSLTARLESLEVVRDVELVEDRWIVAGFRGMALTGADGPTFLDQESWLTAVVRVDDGYVVVGNDDPMDSDAPLARWSATGASWSEVPIEGGPREPYRAFHDAAFDGKTLVVVGKRGENAMAWHSGD